jgi:alkylation response protein AidB-like acyl-CoA dehydrogenase
MDLLPTPEQIQIQDVVRQFLADSFPVDRLRNADQHDRHHWQKLVEMGLFGMAQSEELGGAGFDLPTEILVAKEMGRSLLSPSVLATSIAAHAAAAGGKTDLARDLIEGRRLAAFALEEVDEGTALTVLDASEDQILVVVRDDVITLFEPGAAGSPARSLDESLVMSAHAERGQEILRHAGNDGQLINRLRLLLAAHAVGIAESTQDMSVSYAKERVQFGQPIGAFQAIKHRCADMATQNSVAWWQTVFAAVSLQSGASDASFQVASARYLASRAALFSSRESIQIHGGMGFTDECHAHRFLKRTHILDQIVGNMRDELEHVVALAGVDTRLKMMQGKAGD